ncbi:MAG: hypothetical protein ACLVJZ_09250 [[Clostridium] leptum]
MLVNPILLIFGLFLLGVVICFYIVRRPTRPYLSGVCLILLALFLGCTAVVNASLPPVSQFDWANEVMKADAVCRFSKTAYPGGMRGFLSGVPVHRHRLGNSDAGKHRL